MCASMCMYICVCYTFRIIYLTVFVIYDIYKLYILNNIVRTLSDYY